MSITQRDRLISLLRQYAVAEEETLHDGRVMVPDKRVDEVYADKIMALFNPPQSRLKLTRDLVIAMRRDYDTYSYDNRPTYQQMIEKFNVDADVRTVGRMLTRKTWRRIRERLPNREA